MKTLILLSLVVLLSQFTLGASPQETAVLKEACVASLCSFDNNFYHPFYKTPSLANDAYALTQPVLTKPIQNYMGRLIHMALLQDKLIREFFEKPRSVPLTPQMLGAIQGTRYLVKLSSVSAAFEKNSDGGLKLNQDKLKAILVNVTPEETAAYNKTTEIINATSTKNAMLKARPLEMYLSFFHAGLSFVEAQKLEAQNVLRVHADLEKIFPLVAPFNPVPLVVKQALVGETLSFPDRQIFKNEISNANIFSLLLKPENLQLFAKIPLDMAPVLTDFSKFWLRSKKSLAVANPTSFKNSLKTAGETCQKQMTVSYGALPSEKQLGDFKTISDAVLMQAKEVIESKTKTSVGNEFQIQLVLPTDRDRQLIAWKNRLENEVTELDQALRLVKSLSASDLSVQQILVFIAASSNSDNDVFEDALNFCDQSVQPVLDDATLPDQGVIQVSWSTVINPQMGVGVLAHEIGHVVFAKYRGHLKAEESCLVAAQGGTQYLGEDFADLFSVEVMKKLNFKINDKPIKNFACGFLAQADGHWQAGELKNADASDVHSSGLYRILSLTAADRALAPQCTEYLASIADNRFTPYCRWVSAP